MAPRSSSQFPWVWFVGIFVTALVAVGVFVHSVNARNADLQRSNGASKEAVLGHAWARARVTTEQLLDDAKTRALWRMDPELHTAYATEEEFAAAVAAVRVRLAPLPVEEPGANSHFEVRSGPVNGAQTETIIFVNPRFSTVKLFYRRGMLAGFSVS